MLRGPHRSVCAYFSRASRSSKNRIDLLCGSREISVLSAALSGLAPVHVCRQRPLKHQVRRTLCVFDRSSAPSGRGPSSLYFDHRIQIFLQHMVWQEDRHYGQMRLNLKRSASQLPTTKPDGGHNGGLHAAKGERRAYSEQARIWFAMVARPVSSRCFLTRAQAVSDNRTLARRWRPWRWACRREFGTLVRLRIRRISERCSRSLLCRSAWWFSGGRSRNACVRSGCRCHR